jgi:uncharacterized protein
VNLQKHLLVDGSNILHAWEELRRIMKRDRDAARARLSKLVSVLHDGERMRVTLVFDGRGSELVVEHPSGQTTFTHLYTPSGSTADDIIEQLVARSREPAFCLVATDDRAERQTIEALGASGLSAADLGALVEQASGRMGSKLAERKRTNDREWRR